MGSGDLVSLKCDKSKLFSGWVLNIGAHVKRTAPTTIHFDQVLTAWSGTLAVGDEVFNDGQVRTVVRVSGAAAPFSVEVNEPFYQNDKSDKFNIIPSHSWVYRPNRDGGSGITCSATDLVHLKSTAHSCIGADHTKPRIDNGIFYYSAGGDSSTDQTMGDAIAGQGLAVGDVVTYYASTGATELAALASGGRYAVKAVSGSTVQLAAGTAAATAVTAAAGTVIDTAAGTAIVGDSLVLVVANVLTLNQWDSSILSIQKIALFNLVLTVKHLFKIHMKFTLVTEFVFKELEVNLMSVVLMPFSVKLMLMAIPLMPPSLHFILKLVWSCTALPRLILRKFIIVMSMSIHMVQLNPVYVPIVVFVIPLLVSVNVSKVTPMMTVLVKTV